MITWEGILLLLRCFLEFILGVDAAFCMEGRVKGGMGWCMDGG